MKGLNDILSHKYLVVSRLVAVVYGKYSNAGYTRILTRKSGRHRYTKEEYQKLIKFFRALAKKLKEFKFADYIDENGKFNYKKFRKQFPFVLSLRRIIKSTSYDYYDLMDQFRGRKKVNKTQMGTLTRRLHKFAEFIENQLEIAKKEARNYNFSYGPGPQSHLH